MPRKRYVVVGEGAAGLTAAEELRRLDPQAAIGVFTEEPQPAYFRAALTNYILGELREDQLWLNAPDFCETQGIRRAFARVLAVDAARGELRDSSSAEPTPFDALLVASGARPRPPSFDGATLPGVVTLRTLFDARVVMDTLRLRGLARAVVLGGGALGLEWAHALLERGCQVTLVERAERLLPSALDAVGSDLLSARLRSAGIELCLGDEVLSAEASATGAVAQVTLRSGRRIQTELVAAALGVVPNTEWLRASGLRLSASGAVLVDGALQTSAPNVWAAGDVANVEGREVALWEPARQQGRIAARNMVGGRQRYEPFAHYFATRLFDLDFAKVGDISSGPDKEEVVDFPRFTGKISYRKLVLERGVIVGALMLGERSLKVRTLGRALKRLIDARADVSAIRDKILAKNFDLNGWLEARRLLAEPVRAKTSVVLPPPAELRATHVLRLPSGTGSMAMPVALEQAAVPNTAAFAAPRATKRLSIGLPAEASRPMATLRPVPTAALQRESGEVAISRSVTSLGQSPEADVRLVDPSAAAIHAQIVEHEGAFFVRDLGSQSGTWLNGQPLCEARRLTDGDRIQIGAEAMVFRGTTAPARKATATAMVAAPRLFVRSGGKVGLGVRLVETVLSIGSDPASSLCLTDPGIAPLHARLHRDANGSLLTSLAPYTWLGSQALAPGRSERLQEGSVVRLGSIDLVYSEGAAEEASRALAPQAKLVVDSGAAAGQTLVVNDRALIGSAPHASFVLAALQPNHLEIVRHGPGFFVRDLSGGRSLRAARALGPEWSALEHGDMLLLSGSTLLRFEET